LRSERAVAKATVWLFIINLDLSTFLAPVTQQCNT
jgi:hypothetical protein